MSKISKAKGPGRRREGKDLRVVLGASVRPDTRRQVLKWTAEARRWLPEANPGRVLDMLVEFGRSKRFRP